ncbi:MAG TPA: ATPase/DNA packaging protein [Aquella sp.]|nr:ATPase/DNA packaging protein [Aquella sp.]
MEITDYTKEFNILQRKCGRHAPIFPTNIFCVLGGATGSGKSNLMLNLLKKEKMLNYSNVYVYSSTLYQPAYVHLKEYYETFENCKKCNTSQSVKIADFFDTDEEIINPSELDKNKNHIMIFDDVMLKDQSVIKDYFCRGRHNNVNVFYLCQSLHKIAKHCIRENANMFILFKQDDKTLKYFHETHISGDMDFKEFKIFCDGAWYKKHGFVVINIWDNAYCGRYWANYNKIYTPEKYIKYNI